MAQLKQLFDLYCLKSKDNSIDKHTDPIRNNVVSTSDEVQHYKSEMEKTTKKLYWTINYFGGNVPGQATPWMLKSGSLEFDEANPKVRFTFVCEGSSQLIVLKPFVNASDKKKYGESLLQYGYSVGPHQTLHEDFSMSSPILTAKALNKSSLPLLEDSVLRRSYVSDGNLNFIIQLTRITSTTSIMSSTLDGTSSKPSSVVQQSCKDVVSSYGRLSGIYDFESSEGHARDLINKKDESECRESRNMDHYDEELTHGTFNEGRDVIRHVNSKDTKHQSALRMKKLSQWNMNNQTNRLEQIPSREVEDDDHHHDEEYTDRTVSERRNETRHIKSRDVHRKSEYFGKKLDRSKRIANDHTNESEQQIQSRESKRKDHGHGVEELIHKTVSDRRNEIRDIIRRDELDHPVKKLSQRNLNHHTNELEKRSRESIRKYNRIENWVRTGYSVLKKVSPPKMANACNEKESEYHYYYEIGERAKQREGRKLPGDNPYSQNHSGVLCLTEKKDGYNGNGSDVGEKGDETVKKDEDKIKMAGKKVAQVKNDPSLKTGEGTDKEVEKGMQLAVIPEEEVKTGILVAEKPEEEVKTGSHLKINGLNGDGVKKANPYIKPTGEKGDEVKKANPYIKPTGKKGDEVKKANPYIKPTGKIGDEVKKANPYIKPTGKKGDDKVKKDHGKLVDRQPSVRSLFKNIVSSMKCSEKKGNVSKASMEEP